MKIVCVIVMEIFNIVYIFSLCDIDSKSVIQQDYKIQTKTQKKMHQGTLWQSAVSILHISLCFNNISHNFTSCRIDHERCVWPHSMMKSIDMLSRGPLFVSNEGSKNYQARKAQNFHKSRLLFTKHKWAKDQIILYWSHRLSKNESSFIIYSPPCH